MKMNVFAAALAVVSLGASAAQPAPAPKQPPASTGAILFVDASGKTLGRLLSANQALGNINGQPVTLNFQIQTFVDPNTGQSFAINNGKFEWSQASTLYFQTNDCSGEAWQNTFGIGSRPTVVAQIGAKKYLWIVTAERPTLVAINSQASIGTGGAFQCSAISFTYPLFPLGTPIDAATVGVEPFTLQ